MLNCTLPSSLNQEMGKRFPDGGNLPISGGLITTYAGAGYRHELMQA